MVVDEFFYGDDTGTHAGATYCLVGGYRASPRQWKKFRQEWRDALKGAAVPEFHANVFFNRKVNLDPRENPYLGWSDDKATKFRHQLEDVIRKRDMHPLGCAVRVPDFGALTYGEQCALCAQITPEGRHSASPYLFAFAVTLQLALKEIRPETRIHFKFGLQPGQKGRAVGLFNLLRGSPQFIEKAEQLASIGYDTSDVALEAADFYVHAWYRALTRGGRLNDEGVETMNALTRKVATMPVADATTFERMWNDLPPDVREHFRNLTPQGRQRRRS